MKFSGLLSRYFTIISDKYELYWLNLIHLSAVDLNRCESLCWIIFNNNCLFKLFLILFIFAV